MVGPNKKDNNSRIYNILVYGIEKKGLQPPDAPKATRNYILNFEQFKTTRRFDEFEGVILFQGIFEDFREEQEWTGGTNTYCDCERDELDKRNKELNLLLEKKGFVCFILCEPLYDYTDSVQCKDTDLPKLYTNIHAFYRKNFGYRTTNVESKRSEFVRFIKRFGAACTYFQNLNNRINIRTIAKVNDEIVGMIMSDRLFFLPSLIPTNQQIVEYFELLAEAITSSCNKLILDIPQWVNAFEFSEERRLKALNRKLVTTFQQNMEEIEKLQSYKRILLLDGDLLVDAVNKVLEKGFEFKIDTTDEFREDVKILDEENKPIIFVEIKGTNKDVQRQHINQCDTHRELAGFQPDFPSILIINTRIKNSRSVEEKNKEIAKAQRKYATQHNVLILRTLDLLRLLRLFLKGDIKKDVVLTVLKNESGWLRVNDKPEVVNK